VRSSEEFKAGKGISIMIYGSEKGKPAVEFEEKGQKCIVDFIENL